MVLVMWVGETVCEVWSHCSIAQVGGGGEEMAGKESYTLTAHQLYAKIGSQWSIFEKHIRIWPGGDKMHQRCLQFWASVGSC